MDLIYTISRSKRRTLAIKISEGEVRVLAPNRFSDRKIAQVLATRESWIRKHLQRQQALISVTPERSWQHGETIPWLGLPLQLHISSGTTSGIERVADKLHITLGSRVKHGQRQIRSLVIQWYQQQAQAWLNEYLPQAFTQPRQSRIASYKAKWGACTRSGEVSLSWKLWLAPEWVVTYVVQHELVHLTHFDHSKAFWQRVAEVNPDYRKAESWLRQHGHTVLSERYLNWQ